MRNIHDKTQPARLDNLTTRGASWRNTLPADQHIYDVTVDKRNGVLYTCGFESSVWRSDDRGETWRRLRATTSNGATA
jgi:photosystem II stability/assembly factor-like uncharacterized protein